MMGDMDMGDFMSMGMMMPPNMMDGGLPMAMAGMPNAAMLGLPMGMPPPPQAGGNDPAMRNNRMNARGTGRNMPMNRAKNADGKEGGNEM
jgi:pre-mRNA 3'-end-processing factor FIP1